MQDKKPKIKNSLDYLMALARNEREEAEKMLDAVRSENDYYKEKVAAKLADFLAQEERLIRLLVELKRDMPEAAEMLEERKPHLKTLLETAQSQWQSLSD